MSTTVPSSGLAAPAPADPAEAPDAHGAAAVGSTETGPGARARAAPWGADPYANALRTGRGPLFLRRNDGWLLPLDVERWCSDAGSADLSALHRCEGPVLDIGCGPGRLVAELASLGHRALGIDVSEAAVARTRGLGGAALVRSVFDPLPGEGRWGTLLLLDGNIGIGGDQAALLDRAAGLLGVGGLLIAETAPVDVDERVRVRLDDGRDGADGGTAPAAAHDAEPFPGPGSGRPLYCATPAPAAGSRPISGARRGGPSSRCAGPDGSGAPGTAARARRARTARR
ncbi:Methyltransferase domain-containing protein OS=Streptomyces griseus subsp. griseus (strain JCM 4626/ NBRC) OX=455632 GN=SGR_6702 PE=4 SV=1 [Streptomyces griseus subsp. griseus]